MRLTIDPERCQGHLRCVLHLPDLEVNDLGHAEATDLGIAEDQRDPAERAALNCPERAITVGP